jgi:hypothetical protein
MTLIERISAGTTVEQSYCAVVPVFNVVPLRRCVKLFLWGEAVVKEQMVRPYTLLVSLCYLKGRSI